jgi:methylenetetrahydrofolate dehydrogenase (NADP+) / methenyltetrahydrofolate cyclohydrolase
MTTLELASQAGTMATILDGRAVAEQLRAELRAECEELTAALGASPVLAVVIVGDDPASRSYLNSIKRTCGRIGIECRPIALTGTISEAALCAAVVALNRDYTVSGVLITLPLPAHLSAAAVAETLAPDKDIDGITPTNAGRLALGMPAFAPNTPSGGMEMLRRYNIPIAGKHAVVVGRSGVVGKPMAFLLLQEDATVTICHRRTPDLAAVVRRADIVVTGAGRAHLIDGAMLQPGAVVVDFGINFPDWSEGKMVGDVDFASAVPVAGAITPVPGGTGPVTNMMLMRNTLVAARALAEGHSPLHVG